jgi:hypothetical protein
MPSSTDSASGYLAGQAEKRRGLLWTGRILSGLAILFLLFDAIGKLTMPAPVMDAFVRLGIPTRLSPAIAALLLAGALLYAIPWTAVFGAVLLTGFFGGAVAIHLRAGSSFFETIFPVLFGIVIWAGLLLREGRLGALFPLRLNR